MMIRVNINDYQEEFIRAVCRNNKRSKTLRFCYEFIGDEFAIEKELFRVYDLVERKLAKAQRPIAPPSIFCIDTDVNARNLNLDEGSRMLEITTMGGHWTKWIKGRAELHRLTGPALSWFADGWYVNGHHVNPMYGISQETWPEYVKDNPKNFHVIAELHRLGKLQIPQAILENIQLLSTL